MIVVICQGYFREFLLERKYRPHCILFAGWDFMYTTEGWNHGMYVHRQTGRSPHHNRQAPVCIEAHLQKHNHACFVRIKTLTGLITVNYPLHNCGAEKTALPPTSLSFKARFSFEFYLPKQFCIKKQLNFQNWAAQVEEDQCALVIKRGPCRGDVFDAYTFACFPTWMGLSRSGHF